MKILIINADDAGISDAVNGAVLECLRAGAVTGVSIMACGPRFREAAGMLKNAAVTDAGVHLTLTGGFAPGAADRTLVSSLIDGAGVFPADYKALASRYFLRRMDLRHIYEEFSAQIKAVMREGFRVTHIDSHEHVHVLPGILDVAVRLARELGIKYVRVPLESSVMLADRFSPKDAARHAMLKPFALAAKKAVRSAGLISNDFFLGHVRSGRVDETALCFMADRLADGINELAVHPSYLDGAGEIKVLMTGAWAGKLKERGAAVLSHEEALRNNG